MGSYHVGHAIIQRISQQIGIQATRGRKPKDLTQEEIDFAVNYRNYFHVGYHRTAQAARARGIKTTDRRMQRIFIKIIDIASRSKKKSKKTILILSMKSMQGSFGTLTSII